MTRNRTIRKVGNSWFIKLNPIDILDYELKEGDIVNVEDCLVIYNVRKKRSKKTM